MRTVYIHTTPEGKRYVGATHLKPTDRFNNGRGYKYQFFYQAVLQFGWENITHQLYEVDTEEELKYLERYLISYYDTTNPEKGYNIAKGDLTQDQGYDHPEYGKGNHYSQYKESYHKYFTSDKGKESMKKYCTSEKGKETRGRANQRWKESDKGKNAIKQYESSEKGKEAHRCASKKYYHSEKGKETYKRYYTSEKGKETHKKYYENYITTEKGKESRRRAMKRWYEKKKKQTQNE